MAGFMPDTDLNLTLSDDMKKNYSKPASGGGFGWKGAGVGAARTIASGGSVEDAAAQGLVASGNPYAMGAGLALSVLSAQRRKKDAHRQAKAKAENERRQRQVNALQSLVGVTRGIGL